MEKELKGLIRRARQKDPDAFTELIELHKHSMYKMARSILSSDEDARDAIQDTILTCWEKMGMLRDEAFFKTWITRILINKCYDILRAGKRITYVEELPDVPAKEEPCEAEWQDVLGFLEKDYRVAVTLYYAQGFRTREIAKILGIKEATVRIRLSRARKRLKEYYQREV